MILLALACVLLGVWGAGSVAHTLLHTRSDWLGFLPRAAAALIFLGMFFGPTRSQNAPNTQEPGE